MILRLSQKLNAKIKAGPMATLPVDENPLADWSAHLFIVDRTQYILLSNTKSLYSAVMFGKEITNDRCFIERGLSNLREFMEADGLEFVYHRFIVPATTSIRFAKALDRSVTGSMNDLIRQASYWLEAGEMAPFDIGFRLNETPMSALTSDGSPYGIPRKVFKALASELVPEARTEQARTEADSAPAKQTRTNQSNLAAVEINLLGAIVDFHQKVQTLVRQASLDQSKTIAVAARIKTLLDAVTAQIKQTKQFNLKERLDVAYDEVRRLVDEASKANHE